MDWLKLSLGGKRTVSNVRVYGVRPDIEDHVYFEGVNLAQVFIQETVLSPLHFKKDIYFGTESEEVQEMQEYLVSWGYLEKANGVYGQETLDAIYQFQIDFDIVDHTSVT